MYRQAGSIGKAAGRAAASQSCARCNETKLTEEGDAVVVLLHATDNVLGLAVCVRDGAVPDTQSNCGQQPDLPSERARVDAFTLPNGGHAVPGGIDPSQRAVHVRPLARRGQLQHAVVAVGHGGGPWGQRICGCGSSVAAYVPVRLDDQLHLRLVLKLKDAQGGAQERPNEKEARGEATCISRTIQA